MNDQRARTSPSSIIFPYLFYTFLIMALFLTVVNPTTTALGSDAAPQAGTRVWLPLITTSSQSMYTASQQGSEWSQEAHDAQHTGYTTEEAAGTWKLAWTWNGPDSNGGSSSHFYNAPPAAHTVTGGVNIYVPAGSQGLYALSKANGNPGWHLTTTSFNATPVYDASTGFLYAGGADGRLYKVDGASGNIAGTYSAGSGLNSALLLANSSVYAVADDGRLHKVDANRMAAAWVYTSGSQAATPVAYSASRHLLIYATTDLNVHAVREADGGLQWKVNPSSHAASPTYTFKGYWPVVAEQHGIVFLRMNLGMSALWSGPNTGPAGGGGVYPSSNAETRAFLQANNGALENLFALSLDSGNKAFIPAVGFGGVEGLDSSGSPVLQAGPVPVVRLLPDGKEVAYITFRSGQGGVPDGRWDSHLGEMVLDNSTVPGLSAGDLRFVDFNSSTIGVTDEQTPLTMAGDTLFHAHWGASEAARILDRSNSKGLTHDNPITTQPLPTIVRRMASCSSYNASTHWTTCGLTLFGDGRYWPGPGFWVYWNTYDPPTPNRGAYSEGILPRYTYASSGLVVVEGNGGELFVLTHTNS